ncbi:MAG: formylglycine-generating enzyme family protein [Saprospiraceae bacterium]
MNKTVLFCLYLLLGSLLPAQASDLKISNELLFVEGPRDNRTMYAILDVKWKNAWKNDQNHDAVWLFCKFVMGEDGYRHIPLRQTGHEIIHVAQAGLQLQFEVAADGAGLFIVPSGTYRGDVSLKIKIAIDPAPFTRFNTERASFRAFGLEMVKIPTGAFYAGEIDSSTARQYQAFYQPDENGVHKGAVLINAENELTVGKDIAYNPSEVIYQGDGKGVIPKAFPKGYEGFYGMKYEVRQGEYALFLNTLSNGQSQLRSNFGGRDYYRMRGTIAFDGEKYVAASPDRPCNFLSWDDAMAFADWCALRPMTELEFEKACRGNRKPLPNEFPWGNADKLRTERRVNAAGDLAHLSGKPESELSSKTMAEFGASQYWLMDLAGSVWERCITVGDSLGRSFKGTHGDGAISYYGFATNEDWPAGVSEQGGFGFRGGGFYHPDRAYHEFNPFSPVSYRRFGAWSGGNRTEAYGSRLVRR